MQKFRQRVYLYVKKYNFIRDSHFYKSCYVSSNPNFFNHLFIKKKFKNICFYNSLKYRRLPFFLNFYFKIPKKKFTNKKSLVVYRKSLLILRFFIHLKFLLHNGRKFKSFIVYKNFRGFKFGEFLFTRRFAKGEIMHAKKKLKTNIKSASKKK